MTLELTKNEHLKAERDFKRFFASELIDGLRGRHINARWIPVSFEDEDRLEPEANYCSEQNAPFRVFGPGKRSVWTLADYRALEIYPEWRDADGGAYRIILGEPSLDSLKVTWNQRGWVCDHCADPRKYEEMVNHDLYCAWGWLTHSWAQVFVKESGHFRRNPDITKEQAKMAMELLEVAQVLPYA